MYDITYRRELLATMTLRVFGGSTAFPLVVFTTGAERKKQQLRDEITAVCVRVFTFSRCIPRFLV